MDQYFIHFGSQTHAGLIKEHNSDAIAEFTIPGGRGFVVCDGHQGPQGHAAIASKITADEIRKYFANRVYSDLTAALTNAISFANYTVYQLTLKDEKYKGIGSTCAVVLIYKNEMYYAYAGDSRIYFYNNSQLVPLTRDHIADSDNIAENNVTILVGRNKDIKFGVCKNPILIEGSERILLCTDGLTDQVNSADILSIIQNNDLSAEHKAVQLIELANNNGGNDNVSVQIIEFTHMDAVKSNASKSSGGGSSSIWSLVAIVVIIFLVVFLGYQGYKKMVNQGTAEHENKTTESVVENMQAKNDGYLDEEEQQDTKTSDDEVFVSESQTDTEDTGEIYADSTSEDTIEASIRSNQIIVPENKPAEEEINETTGAENSGDAPYYYHLVEKGQNLFRIGLQYNVPLKKLEELNGEKATKLTVGAKLKIPVKALHKVTSGETLFAVSKKYNSSVDDICKANKLDKNKGLTVGKTLVIPLEK